MPLAAENDFLNLSTIREITLIHVTMKTQETTGTTGTLLSKIFGNIHTFKGSVKESENVLRLTGAGGVRPIQGDQLPQQCHLHHLSVHPETLNDEFTASPLSEVVV